MKAKIRLGIALLIATAIAIAFTQNTYAAALNANIGAIRADVLHLSAVSNASLPSSTPKVSTKPLASECWHVSMTVAVTGTNTLSVYGQTYFDCGYTKGGGLSVTATILCSGASAPPNSKGQNFSSGISYDPTYSYLQNFTGYCEACTNHVPTAFPFFTLVTYAYAYSYMPRAGSPVNDPSSYTLLAEGSGGPINTGLVNSSSYRIPC